MAGAFRVPETSDYILADPALSAPVLGSLCFDTISPSIAGPVRRVLRKRSLASVMIFSVYVTW